METLKRILAGGVIVLCILGILVAALGIVAVWRINIPVMESLTQLLTSTDAILEIVESSLVKETSVLLVLIDATIGEEVYPVLEKASATLNSVVESVVAVNGTLEAINSIPFIAIPTLTADLETAEGRLAETQNDVEETQQEVQAAKEEAVDSIVSPVSARLKQVDSDLQFVGEKSTQFESQVTASREGIADVIQKLPGWIDLASVIMTLIFSWLTFAQGSLLLLSYALIRTGEFKITLGDGKGNKDVEDESNEA
jgi:outer membrane murein-binding lipoprotein Lpp